MSLTDVAALHQLHKLVQAQHVVVVYVCAPEQRLQLLLIVPRGLAKGQNLLRVVKVTRGMGEWHCESLFAASLHFSCDSPSPCQGLEPQKGSGIAGYQKSMLQGRGSA